MNDSDRLRFQFGKNWGQFLLNLDDTRITEARQSLHDLLCLDDSVDRPLTNHTFLDIGCGSGLFSLTARMLGAKVHSFDYDRQSVDCALELKRRYFESDSNWTIEQGSILDEAFIATLPTFDYVYSWGVLHHTGSMWKAIENAYRLVRDGGTFCIAIYNDQGLASTIWLWVKRLYNFLPRSLRWIVLYPAFIRLWGPTTVKDFLRGNLFSTWRAYKAQRGMDPWVDVVDWVGGYPFEVATPQQIEEFCTRLGSEIILKKTVGRGIACNEFVFKRILNRPMVFERRLNHQG